MWLPRMDLLSVRRHLCAMTTHARSACTKWPFCHISCQQSLVCYNAIHRMSNLKQYLSPPWQVRRRTGPLSERHAALVIYECLKVVSTCHALGIVHGDVKPANFLLRQRMRDPLRFVERGQTSNWLKAIDFGCSQVLRGSQLHRRTGTPGPPHPSNLLLCTVLHLHGLNRGIFCFTCADQAVAIASGLPARGRSSF